MLFLIRHNHYNISAIFLPPKNATELFYIVIPIYYRTPLSESLDICTHACRRVQRTGRNKLDYPDDVRIESNLYDKLGLLLS